MYHDFSTQESGNIFTFLKKKYKCTLAEALNIINADFNLAKKSPTRIDPNILIGQPSRKKKKIQIRTSIWTPENLSYWFEYGISKSTLEHFNIFPITDYWIDYQRYSAKHSYAYVFGNEYYKILNLNVKKSRKWVTNCHKNIWNGKAQLPSKGELCFITSSMKDVMVLYELGFVSVAPQQESGNIEQKVVDILRRRFKRVIVFYNNDAAGIRAANKLKDEYELPFIHTDIDGITDPSDYSKEFGIIKTKEAVSKWIEVN
jgi:DNA primase